MKDHLEFPTPKYISGVLTPGLPVLPEGMERHPIPGGGSRAVEIFAGDILTIQDVEGLQPVELVFFAPNGTSDAGMIGAKGGRDPSGLKASLLRHQSGRQVVSALWVRRDLILPRQTEHFCLKRAHVRVIAQLSQPQAMACLSFVQQAEIWMRIANGLRQMLSCSFNVIHRFIARVEQSCLIR